MSGIAPGAGVAGRGASAALRRASLVAALGAAGCVTGGAPRTEPGVDPLAATTRGVATMSVQAVRDAAAARTAGAGGGARAGANGAGASDVGAPGAPPPTSTSRADSAGASANARGPELSAATSGGGTSGAALVDDVGAAMAELDRRRAAALADTTGSAATGALNLARLGLWDEAGRRLAAARSAGGASGGNATWLAVAEADLLLRRHRYRDAERVIAAMPAAPDADSWGNVMSRALRARLHVARWQLDSADAVLRPRGSEPAPLAHASLRGRVALLAKRYDDALRIARELQAAHAAAADGFLLEADVHFWKEDLDAVEAPLRAALERDPFDPDARRVQIGRASCRERV